MTKLNVALAGAVAELIRREGNCTTMTTTTGRSPTSEAKLCICADPENCREVPDGWVCKRLLGTGRLPASEAKWCELCHNAREIDVGFTEVQMKRCPACAPSASSDRNDGERVSLDECIRFCEAAHEAGYNDNMLRYFDAIAERLRASPARSSLMLSETDRDHGIAALTALLRDPDDKGTRRLEWLVPIRNWLLAARSDVSGDVS